MAINRLCLSLQILTPLMRGWVINRLLYKSMRNDLADGPSVLLFRLREIKYENIFTVNADTCEAIYYSMGQTMTERYGHKFAGGNYEYVIQSYIEDDVLEEDRHLFDQVRTVDSRRCE